MGTKECKDFLKEISNALGINNDSDWKRVKKWKENDDEYRLFKNQYDKYITLKETKDGAISFVPTKDTQQEKNNSNNTLNKNGYFNDELFDVYDNNILEIFKLSLIKDFVDNYVEKDYLSVFNRGYKNYSSNLKKYIFYKDEKQLEKIIENVSFTSLNINEKTINNIAKNLANGSLENDYENHYFMHTIFSNAIESIRNFNDPISLNNDNYIEDAQPKNCGILYNCENTKMNFLLLNKIPVICFLAGGDWEMPIIGIIYWSINENKLKTYIPTDTKCQIYNDKLKCAYGSESEYGYDEKNINITDEDLEKYEDMKEKVNDRYEAYYGKAIKNLILKFYDIVKLDIESFNNNNNKKLKI